MFSYKIRSTKAEKPHFWHEGLPLLLAAGASPTCWCPCGACCASAASPAASYCRARKATLLALEAFARSAAWTSFDRPFSWSRPRFAIGLCRSARGAAGASSAARARGADARPGKRARGADARPGKRARGADARAAGARAAGVRATGARAAGARRARPAAAGAGAAGTRMAAGAGAAAGGGGARAVGAPSPAPSHAARTPLDGGALVEHTRDGGALVEHHPRQRAHVPVVALRVELERPRVVRAVGVGRRLDSCIGPLQLGCSRVGPILLLGQ